MICYYCRAFVDEQAHREHIELFTVLLESSIERIDDAFVHMRSPGRSRNSGREKRLPLDDCFDPDGVAVVCDRCFVHELCEAVG